MPLEHLAARGAELAAELAAGPTVAIGQAKRLLDDSPRRSLADQLEAERVAGDVCAGTDDHSEALTAAAERRRPVFRGR